MTKNSISTTSETLIGKISSRVRGGLDLAGNAKDVAHHSVDRAVIRTQRFVEGQPFISLVVAAALGAAAALIVSSLLKDDE